MAISSINKLPPGIQYVRTLSGFNEYRLDNGLQILLGVDATTPAPVQIDLVYQVGSKHENYGETGMAHVLEHMVFKQADCDTCSALQKLKQRALSYNAETYFDYTLYNAVFVSDGTLADNLAWFMGWLAGMMNQQSFLAQHRLDLEKVVVRNEYEINEDEDDKALRDECLAAMFKWHNYGNAIIGAPSDVAHSDAELLAAFYRRHYRPDNASLIVSGQIDPSVLLEGIVAHFSPIQCPARPLPAPVTVEPQQQGEREVTLRRVGEAPVLLLGYRGPAFAHPDTAALWLLAKIFQARLTMRRDALQSIVVMDSNAIGILPAADFNILECKLTLHSHAELPKARAAMLALFEAGERLSQAELDAVRQGLSRSDHAAEEGHEDIILGVQCGDWRLAVWHGRRLLALSLAEVQTAADILLQPANRTLGMLVPVDQAPVAWQPAPAIDLDALLAAPQGLAQGVAPAAGIVFDELEAGALRHTLDNGAQVAWFARPGYGSAKAFCRFTLSDAQSGQQYLLPYLLRQLVRLSAPEFEGGVVADVAFMQLDIAMEAWTPGVLEHDIAVLCRALGRSVKLSADECQHLLTGLDNDLDRYGHLTSAAPYPAGHSLYHPSAGDWQTAIRAADPYRLQQMLQGTLSACRTTLGVVGDIDQGLLRQSLQDGFGDWPAAQPFRPLILDVPQPTAQREEVCTPGKKNARMATFLAVPPFSHADYPALKMASRLLGLRLFVRIREQMGLSYSMASDFYLPAYGAPFSIWSFQVTFAPQNRTRVEQGFDEELACARRDGFDEQELGDVKRYFANRRWYQAWRNRYVPMDGDSDPAGILAIGAQIDDDLRHYDRLAALTLDEVNAALRRYLNPASKHRRLTGDFA